MITTFRDIKRQSKFAFKTMGLIWDYGTHSMLNINILHFLMIINHTHSCKKGISSHTGKILKPALSNSTERVFGCFPPQLLSN